MRLMIICALALLLLAPAFAQERTLTPAPVVAPPPLNPGMVCHLVPVLLPPGMPAVYVVVCVRADPPPERMIVTR